MMEQILKVLDKNARVTDAQLASMLGCSEAEATARRTELEKSGIIRGYHALVDWERTDRAYVTAIIDICVTPRRDSGFEGVAQMIMGYDEVESLSLMSGGYDFSIEVSGKTFKEVALFVAKRLSTLEGVQSTATHFVLRRYKEHGISFVDGEKDERGEL